jgi:hypothetical protein
MARLSKNAKNLSLDLPKTEKYDREPEKNSPAYKSES